MQKWDGEKTMDKGLFSEEGNPTTHRQATLNNWNSENHFSTTQGRSPPAFYFQIQTLQWNSKMLEHMHCGGPECINRRILGVICDPCNKDTPYL